MDLITAYSIAFASLLGLYPFLWLLGLLSSAISPRASSARDLLAWLSVLFDRYIRFLHVIPRRYWMSITMPEFLVLVAYLGGNVACLVLGRANLQKTAAMLAVINATPLFLGGRTNPLADLCRVPLSTYYNFHHFIGRVAIAQGILHGALLVGRSRHSQVTTSGFIVSGGLLLILCTSVFFVRRYLYRTFETLHPLLALGTLGGLTWHALCQPTVSWEARIPPLVAGSLWAANTLYRWVRLLFYAASFIVQEEGGDANASWIRLYSKDQSVRLYPGGYFYVYLSGKLLHYNLLNSYPMMVMWYPPNQESAPDEVKDVTLLVSHRRPRLRSVRFATGDRLLIDGPYGQDLELQRFDEVYLVARAPGVAGILSIALYLREWKKSNGAGPIVNIFWVLEENAQVEWASPQLLALKADDPSNETFVCWCITPSKIVPEPIWVEEPFWECFPSSNYARHLRRMVKDALGSAVVVVCGDAEFSSTVRHETRARIGPHRSLEFVELQYRPYAKQGWRPSRPVDVEAGTELREINLNSPQGSQAGKSRQD